MTIVAACSICFLVAYSLQVVGITLTILRDSDRARATLENERQRLAGKQGRAVEGHPYRMHPGPRRQFELTWTEKRARTWRRLRIAVSRAAIGLCLALPGKGHKRRRFRAEAAYRRDVRRYQVCELPAYELELAEWLVRASHDRAMARMTMPTRPVRPMPPPRHSLE